MSMPPAMQTAVELSPRGIARASSQVSIALCRMVEEAAASAIAERGVFSLAVPGGSVLKLLSPLATRKNLDWSKVHMWYVVRLPTQVRPSSRESASLCVSPVSDVSRQFCPLPGSQAPAAPCMLSDRTTKR